MITSAVINPCGCAANSARFRVGNWGVSRGLAWFSRLLWPLTFCPECRLQSGEIGSCETL
jgi:hypothetical protein